MAKSRCTQCDGRCCRYVAIEIDKPTTKGDFDDIRWYTAHRGITVFVEDGQWYVNFNSRCNYLTAEHRCEIYDRRPKICRRHDPSGCEGPEGEYEFELELRTPDEVQAYYDDVAKPKKAGRKKRRKKRP